jgi:RimJ/RimL family protein N-acetyltransferase
MTPSKGKRDVVGSISLESRGTDRLTLGFALAPEVWGKGLATEAARAMVKAGFGLTSAIEFLANVRVENAASRRVLEKCGFAIASTGPLGAPARGGLVECHSFSLTRPVWVDAGVRRRQQLSAERGSVQTSGGR